MSLNRIVTVLVIAGYAAVNVLMQIEFFAGRNIFAKYRLTSTAAEALQVAQQAYYAKTGWLLLLLIMLAAQVPFALAFGLSYLVYSTMMIVFFGLNMPTAIYALAAFALLGSYWFDRVHSLTRGTL